jgi:hypothetical protein
VLTDKTYRPALVAIAIGLVLLLGAGLVAPTVTPTDANGRATGAALGSTGFAYLTGLRTFVAAVLWNQTEPEFHQFYNGVVIDKQLFLLPTLRVVTWLDPQFVQAYYVAQWIVARNGKHKEAFALTQEGIRANPHSGILLASYAQMLFLYSDIASAHKAALRALEPDVKWADALEQWQNYEVLSAVFKKAGDTANMKLVEAKRKELNAEAAKVAAQRGAAEAAEARAATGK